MRYVSTDFLSCYLIFYLCIPFLNILIKNMNEKQHIYLLLLCSYSYIFLSTMRYCSVVMNYVSWFIVLYFIASYIRLYPKKILRNTKFWLVGVILSLGIAIFSIIVCLKIYSIDKYWYPYYFISDSNKILAVTISISAFLFFKNIDIGRNKIINTIAASTFGVLVIHANSDIMRQWLWKDTLQNTAMYDSSLLVIHAIGSVLGIYIVCTIIDYLRIRYIEIPFFRIWDKHWDNFISRWRKLESKVMTRCNIKEE